MKTKLLTLTLTFFSFFTFAQSNYNISGYLVDSAGTLPFTSVFLLTPADSSLVTFTRADENGKFEFKNIKRLDYLIKATFVGYFPYQELQKYNAAELNVNLGKILLKPIQRELLEVVIKTAKAPMSMRGDTVEYDASKFKVPPGSSVEDLLRKLPGFQIDAEGNMKAQGETVKRVTVDGKQFFGDDPKLATKNLPSESISKVQVFNDKTEQSKLTGIDDGKHEKTVNLELKEEFKKGGFGKGTVGAGTDNRVMAKANYNKFDSKNQFSIIGFGNNINQTGLSRDDYQDFKGSQSYSWGNNADFGFSSGGGMFYFFDDNEEEGLEIPQSWRDGQGLSKNYAGGINYNYDTKKTKVSSNYFFNQTNQTSQSVTNSQIFLPNNKSYFSLDSTFNANYSQNHRASIRVNKELDTLNSIVFNVNTRLGNKSQEQAAELDYLNSGSEKFRNQLRNSSFDAISFNMESSLIYRHKFMKKGRSFAWSATYNVNNNDQEGLQQTNLKQFAVNGDNFDLGSRNLNFNQNVTGLSKTNEIKTSLLFIEPLNKKFFLENFYNFSVSNRKVDRDVFNIPELGSGNNSRVDSLSRYFENTIIYNRVGSALRYSHQGVNIGAGAAVQNFDLNGQFFTNQNGTKLGSVPNSYWSVIPNVSINIDLKQNRYFSASYNVGVTAPKIADLQPFVDNRNPLFIKNGNPNLEPTTAHSINMNYSLYNPVSFINMWSGINYTYYKNQVIYNQIIDNALVTTLTPENLSGGERLNGYFNFGFPIIKTKFTAGLNGNVGVSNNLIYINNKLNDNKNKNFNIGGDLSFTPKDWVSLFVNGGTGLNYAEYSLASTQNQQFINNRLSADLTIQLSKTAFIKTDFRYNNYRNNKLGFNQHQPIWNLSTFKLLGKTKKSEIRLTVYDIFKRNAAIRQSAYQNVISQGQTNALTRYFLLSYTYNMRGVTAKVKKNRWE